MPDAVVFSLSRLAAVAADRLAPLALTLVVWGLGGAKPPPQGFEAFFRKNYHAVAVLAAVGEDSS